MGWGCAGRVAPMSPSPTPAAVRIADAAPVAFEGEPIVIFLGGAEGRRPPAGLAVTLDDGRMVTARTHRFIVGEAMASGRWLVHARVWRDESSRAPARVDPGGATVVDVAIVDPPADWAGAAALLAGEEIHIARVGASSAQGAGDGDLWRPAVIPPGLHAPLGQSSLYTTLEPALADPALRWRVALLADRLEAAGVTILTERLRAGLRASAVGPIATVARAVEARWRSALGRLSEDAPETARSLVVRLTAIVALPDGRVVPAWRPALGADGLDALLTNLLNADLSGQARANRARAWLAAQPAALAWVVDDAGLSDPAGRLALARAAVVDLTGREGIARATLTGGVPGPRVTVAPFGSVLVAASAPMDVAPGSITVERGSWRRTIPIAAGPLPVGPPGLRAGPFIAPWSLPTWFAGRSTPSSANRAAAALIRRRVDGSWEVYIECRFIGATPPPGDRVRLWFGPTGRPTALLVVTAAGTVREALDDSDDGPAPGAPVVVTTERDRWSCIVDLPESVVEAPGVVRVGFERRDDTGRRSTWPRPLFVWDDEPGRALVSLRMWTSSVDRDR